MDEACVQGKDIVLLDQVIKCPVTQESEVTTLKYVITFIFEIQVSLSVLLICSKIYTFYHRVLQVLRSTNWHESLFEINSTHLMGFIFVSGFHGNKLAQIITL